MESSWLHGASVGDRSQQGTFYQLQFELGLVRGGTFQLEGLAGRARDWQLGFIPCRALSACIKMGISLALRGLHHHGGIDGQQP